MSTISSRGATDVLGEASGIPRYIGRVVYGFLGATWLTVGLGIGFFVYGGVFGPLSDVGGLLVAVLLWFIVRALREMTREDSASQAVWAIGVGAVLASLVGSGGLVIGNVAGLGFGGGVFLGVQFLGILLQGTWLFGIGYVGLRSGSIARKTSWAGVVAGLGMALGIVALVYSYAVGSFSIGVTLGGLAYVLGISFFALWLARDLSRTRGSGIPT